MESNESKVLSNAARQAKFKFNKAFRSLPPDVRYDIEYMSRVRDANGVGDYDEEKRSRTAIAVGYQVMFPNNIHRGALGVVK